MNKKKGEASYLIITSFVVGMCSMGLEMATSRLLTPYFGSSLYVWTSLIGGIMLCMSIGYSLGGYLADKYNNRKLLYSIILGIGCYTSLIPFLVSFLINPLLFFITTHPLSLFFISFITILLLLGVPFILIGIVNPYIIKLVTIQNETLGRITGKISACATVGCILGTFTSVFLAIPFLGTKKTILCFGLLIITTGLIGLLGSLRKRI